MTTISKITPPKPPTTPTAGSDTSNAKTTKLSNAKQKQQPAASASLHGAEPTARPRPDGADAKLGASIKDAGLGAKQIVEGRRPPQPVPTTPTISAPVATAVPGNPPRVTIPIMPRPVDEQLTSAQERELRETLEGHGLSADEIDRIVEQVDDGAMPNTQLTPFPLPRPTPRPLPPLLVQGSGPISNVGGSFPTDLLQTLNSYLAQANAANRPTGSF